MSAACAVPPLNRVDSARKSMGRAHGAILLGFKTLKIRSKSDIFTSTERILSARVVARGGWESGGVTALFMPAILPILRLEMDPLV